ncbi:MAG: 50S ribosome-binding GTPase [Myxococcales bacterium]|nr:50S ribosome-binding GTPase [Myxococcales bacterium]
MQDADTRPPVEATDTLAPLRVATAGSVDDGKSTLIGRLLYDCRALLSDQLAQVERASRRRGLGHADLALVTDGLRAEREQGITIDVAFRYFATARRRFVLADAPGHVEYTRNMAVAASQADAAVVLVDVRHGVVEQTRRHLTLARLLGVPTVVVAVNKMDRVGFSLEAFARVRDEATRFSAALERSLAGPEGRGSPAASSGPGPVALHVLPLSALDGDNVVTPSPRLPWYDGPALLALLEELPVADALVASGDGARLAVQWVIRPQSDAHPDYRGYAGRVAAGVLAAGDAVTILPSGVRSVVRALDTARGPVARAPAGTSVVVHLAGDVDASRGDWITTGRAPLERAQVTADLAWLGDRPLAARGRYLLKHGARTVPVRFAPELARYDIATGRLAPPGPLALTKNELALVGLEVGAPLPVEPASTRAVRGFLLLDPATHDTVAAGLLRG